VLINASFLDEQWLHFLYAFVYLKSTEIPKVIFISFITILKYTKYIGVLMITAETLQIS